MYLPVRVRTLTGETHRKLATINPKRVIKELMNKLIPELSILLGDYLFLLFSFQRTYRVISLLLK